MKIVKKANGRFLRMTNEDWQNIGRTSGWGKKHKKLAAARVVALVKVAGGWKKAEAALLDKTKTAADVNHGWKAMMLGALAAMFGVGEHNIEHNLAHYLEQAQHVVAQDAPHGVSSGNAHSPHSGEMPDDAKKVGDGATIQKDDGGGGHHDHTPEGDLTGYRDRQFNESPEGRPASQYFSEGGQYLPDEESLRRSRQQQADDMVGGFMQQEQQRKPIGPRAASVEPVKLVKTAKGQTLRMDEQTWLTVGQTLGYL